MITLALMGFASAIFKLPVTMTDDTQIILVAICIASDLNILSRILGK
jgi:hypothetical protein